MIRFPLPIAEGLPFNIRQWETIDEYKILDLIPLWGSRRRAILAHSLDILEWRILEIAQLSK
jgi:hypothetical protein